MAGFTTVDEIINALTVDGNGQRVWFNKLPAQNTVANRWVSLWKASGTPTAGSDPDVGLAGAVTCTSSTTGALSFTNAGAGNTLHLLSTGAVSYTVSGGTLLMVDRLAHANIVLNQATGSFSPVLSAASTNRLSAGEGAQIVTEVTTALASATRTRNFTYTNQAGTSSRTTQDVISIGSAVVGGTISNDLFWPLQAGDTGVRSIEATTDVSGTGASGAFNVVLVRVLAQIPLTGITFWTDRDFVIEIPTLPKIYDDSCIGFYWVSNTAGQNRFYGDIRMVEN